MPGGRGKPRRACKLCKPEKYAGNASERTPYRYIKKLQPDDQRHPEKWERRYQSGW